MRLLGQENLGGGRLQKWWLHTGANGDDNITIQIVQDAAPIIKRLRDTAQSQTSKNFRLKASIPTTMIDEASKINAKTWGISVKDAFSELIQQKSDRSKRALKLLTEGRDYRLLQAKHYA